MDFVGDPVSFIGQWLLQVLEGWGLSSSLSAFLMRFLSAGVLAMSSLMFVIFLIWFERKIAGRFQDRFGPNRVGPWGIIQPFADMLKIFTKEYITPQGADQFLYNLAPVLKVGSSILMWAVIPFAITICGTNLNVGVLFIAAAGALGELGIIMAGWSSNNKYALLGAFRVVAQLISYEVPMVLALLIPVMLAHSMDLNTIIHAQQPWFILTAPLAALIFFVCSIAEVGRAPFDLIEAESEIVAGFNIEYSGLKFGMFYVGEFLHAFTTALLFAALFLGGWQGPGAVQYPVLGIFYFVMKTFAVYFVTLWIRFTVPRFRIDQMMAINWKLLTPLSLVVLLVTALIEKTSLVNFPISNILTLLSANGVVLFLALELVDRNIQRRRKVFERRLAEPVIPQTILPANPED
jgi:NADH-quinone oxidoreductase subunit H